MKAKTFGILSAILVVVLAAGALIVYQKARPKASLKMGTPMIAGISAGDIAAIHIRNPAESIELVKGSTGWVVRTRYRYPADFSRIRELVDTVKEAKIGRSFESTGEIQNRLALLSPIDTTAAEARRGTLIELKNEKGDSIAEILIGKTRKRGGKGEVPDGQYVMLDGSQNIFLVDKIFTSFQTGHSSWLAKNPVQINGEDISKISCEGPDGEGLKYVFERDGKGEEYTLTFPSSGVNVDTALLNRLSDALSSFQIEDVQIRTSGNKSARPSEADAASKGTGAQLPGKKPGRINFTLFDGLVYHVYPDPDCSETGPCILNIDVGWEKPGLKKDEKGKEVGADKTEIPENQPDMVVRVAQENERLSPWVFVVPKWRHDAFITDLQELIVQDKKEKT